MLTWMAWTWPTAFVFIFIFSTILVLGIWEKFRPGGMERRGVLGLVTTRGDRLFVSLLGSVFIFLLWLGLVNAVLWFPLGISLLWWGFCFWKV